jgi:toxin HigB-1
VIKSIRHKGLKLLWEEDKRDKLPTELIAKLEVVLEVIDSAHDVPKDFEAFKSWNLHKLAEELKDYWSVKINKNYRIIFRFDEHDAYDLDYIDYH